MEFCIIYFGVMNYDGFERAKVFFLFGQRVNGFVSALFIWFLNGFGFRSVWKWNSATHMAAFYCVVVIFYNAAAPIVLYLVC